MKPMNVEHAAIPENRPNMSDAFKVIGLDFAGPLYMKLNRREHQCSKVYIVIFTGVTTGAVHLQLV